MMAGLRAMKPGTANVQAMNLRSAGWVMSSPRKGAGRPSGVWVSGATRARAATRCGWRAASINEMAPPKEWPTTVALAMRSLSSSAASASACASIDALAPSWRSEWPEPGRSTATTRKFFDSNFSTP